MTSQLVDPSITLRDYQEKAIGELRAAFAGGSRRVLFVLATGAGKTISFSYMANESAKRGRRVWALAHREPLIEQISDTFSNFGIDHGVIMSGRSMDRRPVQVGMIGTIANRIDRMHPPDFIIADEAHHSVSAGWKKILEAFPRAFVLGVTATPERLDGTGLGEVYERMVIGPSPKELIGRGHLSKYRLFVPPQQFNLDGVKSTGGDFQRGQLADRVDKPTVTGDAVQHYRKLAFGQPFVAFCVSREHAAHVAQDFSDNGIPTRNIDGTMGRTERADILGALADGSILGVTSCELISEGFDLPKVVAAIMLRPTQSLGLYLQQIGRALRTAPGKSHAVILDHVGNSLRFGMPDDDREWTLEGRKKGEKKPAEKISIRHCKLCFAVYQSHIQTCPHCGGVAEKTARKIEERDGELIEITPSMERFEQFASISYRQAVEQIQTVNDVQDIMKARGFKPGWGVREVMKLQGVDKYDAARLLGYHPKMADRLEIA